MFKNKKTIIALLFIFSFACAIFVSQAGTLETGLGWLWDGSGTNLGWMSMNNVTSGGAVSYGINIPAADGVITGYAWSENVGWINFAPTSPYPTAPAYSARRTGNNLEGWVRIESIATAALAGNAGGWLGWAKLSGTNYGVSIDPTTNKLAGFAWSDELGWIDFSRATVNIPKTITGSLAVSPQLVGDAVTPVTVTAIVTGGTAMGNSITYELDCTNNGTFEATYASTTGELNHVFTNACTYSASATVAVKITRDSASVTPTQTIIFGCVDSVCDETDYTCGPVIKASNCTSNCNATNCVRPRSLNWREVSPND